MTVALYHSFPIHVPVDLHYRPRTYVADWCATAAAVQNIVGEVRREAVHQRLSERRAAPAIPSWMLEDRLPRRRRDAWVANDPVGHTGGEFLPPYRQGEMELARLVVATSPAIVISLRGRMLDMRFCTARLRERWGWPFWYSHRVVGEGETRYACSHEEVAEPLSLLDVILLLDNVRAPHLPDLSRRMPFPEALLLECIDARAGHAAPHELLRISSVVYPELGAFYRTRLSWWVAQHLTSSTYRVPQAPALPDAMERWWRGVG
ncbi:MAG: hypothetical protein K2R93_02965 [Gemmatimonadaceae bacterium]|nr:hypothetical protein [Gemmatimonadaceae bacterium]